MNRTANDDLGIYGEDQEDEEDGSPSGTNRNNARIFSNSVGKQQGRSVSTSRNPYQSNNEQENISKKLIAFESKMKRAADNKNQSKLQM